MPKLPDATSLGQRPVPQPGGGTASFNPPDEGGAARIVTGAGQIVEGAGRMVRGVGNQLEGAGDEMFRAYKVEKDRLDTLRAEDAYSRLRERQLDLTVGEQNGFTKIRAGDAIKPGFYNDYNSRFTAAAKEIAEGLDDDEQRGKFRLRASAAALQYRENLLQHISREGDVYAKQVYEGTLRTETRLSTAEWQNPNAVDGALMRIGASITDAAKRFGWSPEYTEAQRQQAFGAVHSAVIGQALASHDFRYAKEWYDKNRPDVDAQTAKALESKIYDETQKGISAQYREQFLGVRNNAQAIDKLVAGIMADKTLDDARRVTIVGPMMTRSEQLKNEAFRQQQAAEARAERERTRTEKIVETGLSDVNATIRAGYEPDPKALEPLLNSVRGNPYLTSLVERTMKLASDTRTFRLATPREQEMLITRAETEMRQTPGKFDRQVLDAWKQIHQNQQREVRADPITFGVRQGVLDPTTPAAAPIDLTNPGALGPQLSARMEAARGMAARYGVPVKPLTKEETDLLRSALDRAPPERKVEYFGSLRTAFGNDSRGYMAVMGQLAPDDPVTAIAGSQAGKGYNANAALIARGQSYINPRAGEDGKPAGGKLIALPPPAEFERVFADKVGDAFAGRQEARSGHLQAFTAAYAALASDKGGETALKTLDSTLADQAFEKVLGRAETWNGRKVVLPFGYTYGQFKDGMRLRVSELRDNGAIDQTTASKLMDLPLVNRGDGRYVFMAGDSKVVDKNGRELELDFNSTPFVTSGGNRGEPPLVRIEPPDDRAKRFRRFVRGEEK